MPALLLQSRYSKGLLITEAAVLTRRSIQRRMGGCNNEKAPRQGSVRCINWQVVIVFPRSCDWSDTITAVSVHGFQYSKGNGRAGARMSSVTRNQTALLAPFSLSYCSPCSSSLTCFADVSSFLLLLLFSVLLLSPLLFFFLFFSLSFFYSFFNAFSLFSSLLSFIFITSLRLLSPSFPSSSISLSDLLSSQYRFINS